MQYVYILESKRDGDLYVGCTTNIEQRLKLHNSGSVPSTKDRIPFKLIHYEVYLHPKDAYKREKYLKSGWGKNFMKKNLKYYLTTKNLGG